MNGKVHLFRIERYHQIEKKVEFPTTEFYKFEIRLSYVNVAKLK